jgi:MarR family transcriptional regulator, negative regulator of the multidrug operon emrRAB
MDNRSANLIAATVVALADELDATTRRASVHGPSGASALVTIFANPGERIEELSRVLGITSSGTVRLVDRLAADGLVDRRPGSDGRSVSLWLTERGSSAAEGLLAERRQAVLRALEPLTEARRRELVTFAESTLARLAVDRTRADRICRLCDYEACRQGDCPVENSVS